MENLVRYLVESLGFVIERINWLSVLDLAIVTLIFFGLLTLLRDTQAVVLLRGILVLVALVGLLTSLDVLPAFSWLVQTTLPALLISIPVIFAPEIRCGLERLGRGGDIIPAGKTTTNLQAAIGVIVSAATRLSERRHGALIVLQRLDNLDEYVRTGVPLRARLTTDLLTQIFYPNTPLHDGAVIISTGLLVAASCVMRLSSSGVLTAGTRHARC